MKIKIFLIFTILIVCAEGLFAQANSSSAASKSTRKQTLNFEDELVEGSAQKPDLFYLFQRKDVNQGRLIKLRQNFLPEMRKTTEDIQRVRGGR